MYRMRWQDSIWVVPPPQIQTVKKTTSRVVVNIIWRAYVAVSLIDRAKVIAPRSPAEHSTENLIHKQDKSGDLCLQACVGYLLIYSVWVARKKKGCRGLKAWISCSLIRMCIPLTRKHHHVLEVGSDLVASPQIKKERERVDVSSSSEEHCQLVGNKVKERTTKQADLLSL